VAGNKYNPRPSCNAPYGHNTSCKPFSKLRAKVESEIAYLGNAVDLKVANVCTFREWTFTCPL